MLNYSTKKDPGISFGFFLLERFLLIETPTILNLESGILNLFSF